MEGMLKESITKLGQKTCLVRHTSQKEKNKESENEQKPRLIKEKWPYIHDDLSQKRQTYAETNGN